MSDRDGSGRTGRQPTSEDVRRLLLTWLQEWCRNDSTFHDDDPMRYFSQRRPGLPRAITDFVSANPHPILSTALSTPTPTKRSEAEDAFEISQRTYVFIDHLDNKEWDPLLGMMTRTIKVPKTECRLVPSLGNKVNFNYTEEPSSEYVEHLKGPEGLQDSRLVTNHQLGASFITPVSSSEKHAHFQTKIVQMRYAGKQYREDISHARIEARANAVMEMTLIFKKDEGVWKVSGMAGFIRWIEFNKLNVFVGTNHPEKDPLRKKTVENTLRYHRLLPGSKIETTLSSRQQAQSYPPQSSRGNSTSLEPRYRTRDDAYLGRGYQGGHPADQQIMRYNRM